MKVFGKIIKTFSFWLFLQKAPILDVLQNSKFTSAGGNNMKKNPHLRCGQGLELVFVAINYSQKDSS